MAKGAENFNSTSLTSNKTNVLLKEIPEQIDHCKTKTKTSQGKVPQDAKIKKFKFRNKRDKASRGTRQGGSKE